MLPKETISPLQFLKGVGPVRAQTLARLGISTPLELLTTFPRDWQDRRLRFTLRQAPMGEKATVTGKIIDVDFAGTRKGLGVATATLHDADGTIRAVWFKKMSPRYDVFSSLRSRLQAGRTVMVYGLIEIGIAGKQVRVEEMAILDASTNKLATDDKPHLDRIVPLYPSTDGVSERLIRSLVARLLSSVPEPSNIVPAWLLRSRQMPDRSWAIRTLHFPGTWLEKEQARKALAFEEFLILEVALAWARKRVKEKPKPHAYQLRRTLLTPFREHLGFPFTGAQKRVIREIFQDLLGPSPMNRLLQGDVGSGKTVVALCAMLLAVENNGQAALMTPTEILAEQHGLTFQRFLAGLPVRWAVLTSRQTGRERNRILQGLASGEIHLAIGTHALIQEAIAFRNLMLAVIDEQHRFGVEHRSVLRQKGLSPDVLVMTATPIPRTLALTVYGDLDVSTLDELPPGRSPITTRHATESEAYQMVGREAAGGHQAYVVFPLIEESSKVELKAVVEQARRLGQTVFRGLRVGVLHGRMTSREKEQAMNAFRQGALDILMTTSVIEVGIDVPNATMMVIQHAERFGIAALHQLRGRVGRGSFPSQCLLIAGTRSPDARRRIEILTQSQDGFRLSEEDLSLRGPGEVLGSLQHGLPLFKVGHLIRDADLIQAAHQAAEELLDKDHRLQRPDHARLKAALEKSYGEKWALAATG